MHTDLSQHLHTDECNKIIKIFRECQLDHPVTKFLGKCDSEYTAMTKCLKQERIARQQRNMEISKERKDRLNKIFKEQAKVKQDNNL